MAGAVNASQLTLTHMAEATDSFIISPIPDGDYY